MIKHIAMFKFGAFDSKEQKEEFFQRVINAFDKLEDKIPEIKALQIGFDVLQSDASFDFAVNVDVQSLDTLKTYANHPEHLKAVVILKEKIIERRVIDYEF